MVLEQYRLISTAGLKPEAVPLNAKVVLVGILSLLSSSWRMMRFKGIVQG